MSSEEELIADGNFRIKGKCSYNKCNYESDKEVDGSSIIGIKGTDRKFHLECYRLRRKELEANLTNIEKKY